MATELQFITQSVQDYICQVDYTPAHVAMTAVEFNNFQHFAKHCPTEVEVAREYGMQELLFFAPDFRTTQCKKLYLYVCNNFLYTMNYLTTSTYYALDREMPADDLMSIARSVIPDLELAHEHVLEHIIFPDDDDSLESYKYSKDFFSETNDKYLRCKTLEEVELLNTKIRNQTNDRCGDSLLTYEGLTAYKLFGCYDSESLILNNQASWRKHNSLKNSYLLDLDHD